MENTVYRQYRRYYCSIIIFRLSELERETIDLKSKNAKKESELQTLTVNLNEHRMELRLAASRVESLRKQMDDMRRRRQAANAAALSEHRRMQQESATVVRLTFFFAHPVFQVLNRSQDRVVISEDVRPRASVEPFNVVMTKVDRDVPPAKRPAPTCLDDEPSPPPNEPRIIAPMTVPINPATRQDVSPSPPKDPHPTPPRDHGDKQIRATEEIVTRPTSFGESLDEARLRQGRTDAVSLRSDSLKATKRR